MRRVSIPRIRSFASVALMCTLLAGCGSGARPAQSTDIIVVNGTEPQHPLVPTNVNDTGGGKIIDALFSGLVSYDAHGAIVNELASDIQSTDNTVWHITIDSGHEFSNGEPITADSFIQAWNYGAQLSHAQVNATAFDGIVGFSATHDSPLSGVVKDSESSFTVTLTAPSADFPLRLGYHAFAPLPQAFFSDPVGFGEHPIGNGPYVMAESGWEHNQKISLRVNPNYRGPRVPVNGGIDFVLYSSLDAAYSDLLAGNLDVLDAIPTSALANAQADLPGRVITQPAGVFQSILIPQRLAHFGGREGQLRRQAISRAIDRELVSSVIFHATRQPAQDFTTPTIPGWSSSIPGAEVLQFDQVRARELWAQANEISPWDGSFAIAYNADGGHQDWVDAIANSIKNTLGIDAAGAPLATLKDLRTAASSRTLDSAFRFSWQGDYPTAANFLEPLYATGARANDGDYSNPVVDALFHEGDTASTPQAAVTAFQGAQRILLADLPTIPLWYGAVVAGMGTAVTQVTFGWNGVPVYDRIERRT